jgi:hypothetical protein
MILTTRAQLPVFYVAGKTLTFNNTLILAGTDGSTLNIGAGGTLGSAAFQNTGTSGANVPLLNGNNTQSGSFTMTGGATITPQAASGGLIINPTGANSQAQIILNGRGAGGEQYTSWISSLNAAIKVGPRFQVFSGSTVNTGNVLVDIQTNTGQFFTDATERFGYDATGFYTGTTASKGRFSVTGGKTAAIQNTLTFTGTDSSSVAFGAGGTVAYINQSYSGVAAGAGYTLTNSYSNVEFSVTDPFVSISRAGNYYLFVNLSTALSGTTFAALQTASFKLRRNNNTPVDIGSARSAMLPIMTTFTGAGPSVCIGPFAYSTANTDDEIVVQGVLSAAPGAGSVVVDACEIVAIRA